MFCIGAPLGVVIGLNFRRASQRRGMVMDEPSHLGRSDYFGGIHRRLYSISKPAKIAGKVSPIEAYRTNGSLQNCKPPIHLSRKITPFSLAKMNTSRNRKKFLMTSFSLAISGTIFMVGSTFLTSFNQEAYARNGIMEYGEIRVYLSENAAQVNELGYAGVQVNIRLMILLCRRYLK